ncbi:MAG: 3'-5' exonuclease, partial [Candidatus Heimdallarchaeaceae archaeon]
MVDFMENHSPLECLIIDLDFFVQENEKGLEEPTIRIRGKTTTGENIIVHVKDFYPYFYVDDLPVTTKALQSLLFIEKEFGDWIVENYQVTKYTYYQNKPIYLYKILGRNPWKILSYSKFLKEKGIKSYENDISYTSRFLIDTGCKGLNWIKVKGYEIIEESERNVIIETTYKNIEPKDSEQLSYNILSLCISIDRMSKEGKRIENFSSILSEGEKRILTTTISWGTEEGKVKHEVFVLEEDSDEKEREMLLQLINRIHTIAPDVIVAFNSNQVMFPYLLKRFIKLNLDSTSLSFFKNAKIKLPIGYLGFRIPGYITYDLVKSTRWLRTKSGRKGLTDLAQEFFGINREGSYDKINQLWHRFKDKQKKEFQKQIEKICIQESQIVHSLFFTMGMEEWLEVIRLVGMRPSEGIYSTPRHLGEFQLFRILYNKKTLIPAEPSYKELLRRKSSRSIAIGGYVLVPKGTLHEAVLITDFTSMFPSIMVSHNIGGESFDASVASPMK